MQGALLHSASSVVTDVALAQTHLPFAGARSWQSPGCPAQDGGSGPGMGQGWVQHVPQELASRESRQGHLRSPGVALPAASFQMTWYTHAWMSPSDVGAACSSLGLLLLAGCWWCGAVPCPQQVPRCAGVLARAAPVCPTCRAPAVPGPDGQCVTVSPGRGDLRTSTPTARCPPHTPQPGVPLLGFVSGETRPIQRGPAQTVCKNSTFCPVPSLPLLGVPQAAAPMGAGGHEVPWSPGMGWRSSLADGGQGWPQGGLGALGGP